MVKSQSISISANAPPSSGSVVVSVVNNSTGAAIAGATVQSNTGDTKTTDGSGHATFPVSEGGVANYFFTVSATGYLTNTGATPPGVATSITIRLYPQISYPYGLPSSVTVNFTDGTSVNAPLLTATQAMQFFGTSNSSNLTALYDMGSPKPVSTVAGYNSYSTIGNYVQPDNLTYPANAV